MTETGSTLLRGARRGWEDLCTGGSWRPVGVDVVELLLLLGEPSSAEAMRVQVTLRLDNGEVQGRCREVGPGARLLEAHTMPVDADDGESVMTAAYLVARHLRACAAADWSMGRRWRERRYGEDG